MIALECCPRRREQVLIQEVSGTRILLNVETGQYYSLDEVGGQVWELCDGTRAVSAIAAAIAAQYDAPAGVVEADVLDLLGELAGEKLLVAGA